MARKRSASVHPAVDGPRAMRPLYAAGGLVRLVPLFAGTLLALALWGAPAAQAAGCTGDTWTNTAGGSWTTGANWSKKAPPTVSEAACITEPGTYTVTISQASATAETLTLGASSGKQTLIVESTAGGNSELHTASGMTVGVNGALTLTQGGIVASADILSGGAIVNEGTLSTLAGAAGGERRLETSITNTGTVAVDTTTLFQNGSTTFTNEGALNLAEAALLKIGSATLTDGTGGSINAAAGASVVLGGSATYNQGNGTTSGALPVLAEASNLNFTGGGAATIHERGYYAHLSGNIAHGQTLAIEGCVGGGNPAIVSVAKSFENAGTIVLTSAKDNGSDCGGGDRDQLKLESGATLTNTGTITTEAGTGGERLLEGAVTNKGTLNIGGVTDFDIGGATLTNEGSVNLEGAARLNIENSAAFTDASGTVNAGESSALTVGSSATYTQGNGVETGNPVLAEASNLNFTGGGAATIHERSYYAHLSGNIAHGQTLAIEGCVGGGNPAIVSVAKSFENAGTIVLTSAKDNGSDCGGSDRDQLKLESGATLTNTGTITTEAGTGGERLLEGAVTNKGTLNIGGVTDFDIGGATLTNEGSVNLEGAARLNIENSAAFTDASGTVNAGESSALTVGSSATYTQGNGVETGNPVLAEASNLNFTGGGAATIHARSYYAHLSGNIAHGQTLAIEGCVGGGNPAIVSVAKSFENAGTIVLTSAKDNGSDCGGSDRDQLKLESGATLTNTGTITTEAGTGGERLLEGPVTNKGTLDIAATTNDDAGSTTFTNEGDVNLANATRFNFESSTTFANDTGGLIDAVGNAAITLGGNSTFDQGEGDAIGNEPIIAEASTIHYTGSGSSVIHARSYYGEITGAMTHNQTLVVEGCVGSGNPAIVVVRKSLEAGGTIDLTSSEDGGNGCGGGDRSSLKVESGATLQNTGTINVEPGIGGERTIEGALENERFVDLSDGVKLNAGTFTQGKNGALVVPIASTSSYGQLAVTGVASLGGTLDLAPTGGFKGELGQKFNVISDSSHENAFIHEANAVITPNSWYKPVYSPTTSFGLEVAEGTPPEKPPANESKPTVSGTAKQGDTLVAQPGTWKGEAFAYSYQWQRCTEAGTECKAVAGAYFRDYLLTGADAGHRLTVAVTAYNAAGGSAGAESAPTGVVSALPLHAAAGETVEGIEGSPVTLDGSGSTPSAEITRYKWKFGDGSEEAGATDGIVHHAYATAGTYEAQLTVSGKGEESTSSVKVTIHPKPKPAEGAVVTVRGGGGGPVSGATVLFVAPDGTRTEAESSSSGEAVLAGLPEGSDTVYAYKSGDKPATATMAVNGAGDGSTTVTLSSGEVASTELKSKELDYEEIVKAGINPAAPENQNVYSFTVKLAFIESPTPPVELHGYVNGGGQFVGSTGGSGGEGGWSCGTTSCESGGGGGGSESPQIVATPEVVENHPLIQWLILKGKAAVLKQFFEVSMLVQNLSPKPFTLSPGSATLNLPAGLSLAPTTKDQHLTEETPAIEGESNYTQNWIIRGDTPGEYPNLSATYNSTLEPFLAPVNVSAALAKPLKVWGKEALQLKVRADEGKLYPGVPYHVWIGVKNVANVPLYNLGLAIEEEPHEHFIFQPRQTFSETAAEVKAGETFWVKNPYILIPDGESESVFNPALSSITFDGEKEHPGENVEKVKPPTVYTASTGSPVPGYVHLQWQPVPGASGYEVFSTANLDTPFAQNPNKVKTSPGASEEFSELPSTATEAYVPVSSNEPQRYAVSAIIEGHNELESSPVVEANGLSGEFGRCVKAEGGKGAYSNSTCTTAKAGGAYEWLPGLAKTAFTMTGKAAAAATLETVGKRKITCSGQSGTGQFSGGSSVTGVLMTFTGCHTSTVSETCSSARAAAGEVVTDDLRGSLGITEASKLGMAKNKLGIDLRPIHGETVFAATCGSSAVTATGSIIVPVKTNKMAATQSLKFAASKGVQKTTKFEGLPLDYLSTQFGAGPTEQSGLALTTTLTAGEAFEVNSVY